MNENELWRETKRLQSQISALRTLETPSKDGWIGFGAAWTFASSTTFTISGDVTDKFETGTKIKLTQTTTKYFYVVSSSYSSPNTTVTITGGSDYTLANAAITNPAYSYASPPDFPEWFNWTPTYTGNGTLTYTSVTTTAKFCIKGKTCYYYHYSNGTISGSGTSIYITMPLSRALTDSYPTAGSGHTFDNGDEVASPQWASASSVQVKRFVGGAYGTGTSKIVTITGFYEI